MFLKFGEQEGMGPQVLIDRVFSKEEPGPGLPEFQLGLLVNGDQDTGPLEAEGGVGPAGRGPDCGLGGVEGVLGGVCEVGLEGQRRQH